MRYIAQKVRDGVLDLSNISTHKLIQINDGSTQDDSDVIGDELCYREDMAGCLKNANY